MDAKKKLADCKTPKEVRAFYSEKAKLKLAEIKRKEKRAQVQKKPVINHAKFILAGMLIASGKAGDFIKSNKTLVDKLSKRDIDALNLLLAELDKKN